MDSKLCLITQTNNLGLSRDTTAVCSKNRKIRPYAQCVDKTRVLNVTIRDDALTIGLQATKVLSLNWPREDSDNRNKDLKQLESNISPARSKDAIHHTTACSPRELHSTNV
jgi:hypothetical protein